MMMMLSSPTKEMKKERVCECQEKDEVKKPDNQPTPSIMSFQCPQ